MSAASDLIAEVKESLRKATASLKSFEGEVGQEVAHFTDFAHLNIAAIHLREFVSSLEHQANQPEPEPEPEPEPVAPEGETFSVQTGMRPMTEADLQPDAVQPPVAAPVAPEPVVAPTADPADPAAGLIAPQLPTQ